jgi:4-amino-4-deoxy-L-arabinose transferase-like glycosyltransferase
MKRANRRSLGIITLVWVVLQFAGIFSPGLLDDVDSVYIEIAREMLHRHDFVTPYIDGIRFFDKPPLMYWMAAGSMRIFGEYDWAARLPLCVAVLALFLAIYALGLRLFNERGAFYAALAFATAIGPYLYTRFFIPDLLICLWMTLGVHCFLVAIERVREQRSPLVPCLLFAATLALNLLTKGLIGLVFPLGFVVLYLAITRQISLLLRLKIIPGTLVFLAIVLPWHVLAAMRNPSLAMPAGNELPAKAGWAWFYLYNEHIARFLGKRVPHDYGQTPVWLFWLYALIWVMPWGVFLPGAWRQFKGRWSSIRFDARVAERVLTVTVWPLLVLIFFTLSSRQEYYSLPALPALSLLLGGILGGAEFERATNRATIACHRWLLLPVAALVACTCAFLAITAPRPAPGTDLATLLSSNPELYNLSLGHLFDLTNEAMGLFCGPLIVVAVGMVVLGPVSYGMRRKGSSYAANLTLALGMTICLLAAHEGLVRFNPILGSKPLADAIVREQKTKPETGDLILLDGELTSGSTLLFYTRQPVHLVNGHVNGPWFGSFWPDAPKIFEDEASLRELWAGPRRVFLMTYVPASREINLRQFGSVRSIASAGGKTVLTNQ